MIENPRGCTLEPGCSCLACVRSRPRKRTRRTPILERIDAALAAGPLTYYELARAVFPAKDYPRAWRAAVQGGPPGLVLTFGAALRRGGYPFTDHDGGFNSTRRIYARKKP